MIINFDKFTSSQVYHTMTQAIIPRPIAWVLSDHGNGKLNLAPFSYFNAVCSDPPIISISIGYKKSGAKKDTWINIEERSHFVVHIAKTQDVDPLVQSALPLAHGVSEVEELELKVTGFDGASLPRLEQAPIAFFCLKHSIIPVGNGPQGLVLGEVRLVYINDNIASFSGDSPVPSISSKGINPLARLGANEFASIEDLKMDY